MMYWMPKFKNLSPWLVPNPPPNEAFDLARLAIERMCSIDLESKIDIYQTSDVLDAVDDTWIVSGQSSVQKVLLDKLAKNSAVYIEGPQLIWLRNKSITYFVLRGDPHKPIEEDPMDHREYDDVSSIKVPLFGFSEPIQNRIALKRSIHEQDDGIIYAVCCTGLSTKDSLLSWVRLLEIDGNPNLANQAILFKFKSLVDKELVVRTDPKAEPVATR